MVNLYRLCGGDNQKSMKKTADGSQFEEYDDNDFEKEIAKTHSCKESLAPYIINPKNKYKVAWDMCMGFVYLFAYFMDPFIFAFHFYHL